jgi:hypothetical protein
LNDLLQREILVNRWHESGAHADDVGHNLGVPEIDALHDNSTPIMAEQDNLRDVELVEKLFHVGGRPLPSVLR